MAFKLLALLGTLTSLQAAEDLPSILKKLDDQEYKIRKEAKAALQKYAIKGDKARINALVKEYANSNSPEVRHSIKVVAMHYLFGKGFLGVQHQGFTFSLEGKEHHGIMLSEVTKNTAAEKAGLQRGDVIIGVEDKDLSAIGAKFNKDNRALNLQEEFSKIIKSHKQGDTIEITYARNGKREKTKATLMSYNKYYGIAGSDKYGYLKSDYLEFQKMAEEFKARPAE